MDESQTEPVTGLVPVIAAPRVDEVVESDDVVDAPETERGFFVRVRSAAVRFATMPTEGWVSLFIVAACVLFTFLQLGPGNLLSDTTPNGGDMGAHVWGPAFLRDHLLPHGRLTGWTPDWYAGFPAYQFYMVLPSLLIALLSYVIPYGVAFKLVAVSGVLSLPLCAWAFGRLTRLPFPVPPLLAVGATAFLFDRSFSILGGNIASTLAGEFAFSISLSLAVLYLGVLGRGLENGRHRGWAALLLAATGLCHLIPLFFAMAGTVVWFILRPGVARIRYLITTLPVAVALTAFWVAPFYLRSRYMNDMGWEKKTDYVNYLFGRTNLDPQLVNSPPIVWVLALAAVGVLVAVVYRRRGSLFWVAMAAMAALAFWQAPQSRLWNARLLPFWYLSLYMLAAIGVAEVFRTIGALATRDEGRPVRWVQVTGALISFAVVLTALAMPLHAMPNKLGPLTLGRVQRDGSYRWMSLTTKDNSFVDSWARWNFTGYERREAYPEYYAIIQTMSELGDERGCGRAMWEHENQHDRYGTPMALMLLPFWTDGCIGSMEGLYFEASSTTPYHFLNQDELSSAPSNAQRDLPYEPGPPSRASFDLGVQHLQMMGVRYYMAISDRMIDLARRNPDLTEVAASGPWVVFEVADSELVTPLVNQPAVVGGVENHKAWLAMSVDWYMDPAAWEVVLTDDGPAVWQRIEPSVTPERKPEAPTEVTNIVTSTDSISFDVSEAGVPVYVKTSYFPNWEAKGADGPWRATPNFMIVIPTSNHVELRYGRTAVDLVSSAVSVVGLVGLGLLFWMGPVVMPEPRRRRDDSDDSQDGEPDGGPGDDEPGGLDGDEPATDEPVTDEPAMHRSVVDDPGPELFDPTEAILGPVADLLDDGSGGVPDGGLGGESDRT